MSRRQKYPDDCVINLTSKSKKDNPKWPGSKAENAFNLFVDGMTVAEYRKVTEQAKKNDPDKLQKWFTVTKEIDYDLSRGYITLTLPKGVELQSAVMTAIKADGFHDALADEARMVRRIITTFSEVSDVFGFEPLETPVIEYARAVGIFLPDFEPFEGKGGGIILPRAENPDDGAVFSNAEQPGGGVFTFADGDDQLALRYDLTAPLARFAAEQGDSLAKPFRRYQYGPVFRNDKPGPGRFRQFLQFDVDSIGAPSPAADAELCALAATAMEEIGVERGGYLIRINNRKILDGVLETIGLKITTPNFKKKRLAILRTLDKLDRLSADGVCDLLGAGRRDESGDFTKGVGLDPKAIEAAMNFVKTTADSRTGVCDRLEDLVGKSKTGREGVDELRQMDSLLDAFGIGGDKAVIAPSVVRGLGYYTGPVFEVELTGAKTGSVGGGGRYDDLVSRFNFNRSDRLPATGLSIGISRLCAALSGGEEEKPVGPVVVLVLEPDYISDAAAMTAELRAAGLRAELYLGGGGMRAQIKYADRRNAPIAVICGADERAAGEITLKDLALGAALAAGISDNAEWRSQPAQSRVPRESLVAEVGKILARAEQRRSS